MSTDDQTLGTSLETQEVECRAFAKRRGLEVVHVFRGQGESAKTIIRPALQETLEYCSANKGKIEAVIVWKLDRFSRNAGDANTEKAKLAKIGVQVYSATEPALNEDNPAARLTFTVLAGVAQFDNEIRGERARLGMKRRAEEGCWPFRAPSGYRNCPRGPERERHREHGMIEPVPELVTVIKKAFRLIASGHYSQEAVFDVLSEKGLVANNGRELCVRTLRSILRNPVYCGYMDAFAERRRGKWTPLISLETFEPAQEALNRQGFMKHQRHLYTYAGVLRCANCSRRVTPETHSGSHRSGVYVYYVCAHCRREGKSPRYWKESHIDDLVAENLKKLAVDQEFAELIADMLRESDEREQADVATERASLSAERDRLLKRKRRVLELYLDQKISDEDYTAANADLSLRLPPIESKLAALRTDQASLTPTAQKVFELAQRAPALYIRENQAEKRRLLDLVCLNLFLGNVTGSFAWTSPWSVIVEWRKTEEKRP